MRVLVTGGAGFIGSNFARSLIEGRWAGLTGAEVVVLDALATGGTLASLAPVTGSPRLRIEVGDIRDPVLVTRLMAGTDLVVHFAAETHVDRSIADGAPFVSVNVLGTQVLLEAAVQAGIGKFVQVSTDEVYGVDRVRLLAGDPAPGSELALLGGQGRGRPAGAGVPPHLRAAGLRHALLRTITGPISFRRS